MDTVSELFEAGFHRAIEHAATAHEMRVGVGAWDRRQAFAVWFAGVRRVVVEVGDEAGDPVLGCVQELSGLMPGCEWAVNPGGASWLTPDNAGAPARRFRATLLWFSGIPPATGRPYLVECPTDRACAEIVRAEPLHAGDIAAVELRAHRPLAPAAFYLLDAFRDEKLAAGRITHTLDDTPRQPLSRPGVVVWFTGLSGAGKTTLCETAAERLRAMGHEVLILDGDLVRRRLSRDLGYSREDRDENIRRLGLVAELATRSRMVALVAAISPYRGTRDEVRRDVGRFVEVHVDAPLAVCEQRDTKGLYRRARAGLVRGVTGVDDPYEPPLAPEVRCHTGVETVEESVRKVLAAVTPLL